MRKAHAESTRPVFNMRNAVNLSRPARIPEFDSVRGIAAAAVAVYHFFLVGGNDYKFGHAAVILFFVLSGFSLHRMLAVPTTYPRYLGRRICRIYLPYLAALILAICLNAGLSRGPVANLSTWFNQTWQWPIEMNEVWRHILFIGNFKYASFNTAFWSLAQELRISLIFPPMNCVLCRQRTMNQGVLTLTLLLGGMSVAVLSHGNMGDISYMALYSGVFALGLLLSLHAEALVPYCDRQPALRKLIAFSVSLGLLLGSQGIAHCLSRRHEVVFSDPLTALGATGCLLLVLCSKSTSDALLTKPLRKLGEISYSLYLVHASILFAIVRLLFPQWGLTAVFGPYLLTSLVIAYLFHLIIERPAIRLSHYFSRNNSTDRII